VDEIDMDREKNIYILDRINRRVTKWKSIKPSSRNVHWKRFINYLDCWHRQSSNDQFNSPTGIFIDENNGLKELFEV